MASAGVVRRSVRSAVVLLVVIAAATAFYAWSFTAFERGNSGGAVGPEVSAEPSPTPIDSLDGRSGTALAFAPLGRVAFGVEVRNALWLPVTIEGLAPGAFPPGGLLLDARLYAPRDPSGLDLSPDGLRPFEPITLGPGESVFVAVAGHLPDCASALPNWSPGTSAGYDVIPLAISVLGIPRSADAPLIEDVVLMAPDRGICPT